MSQTQANVANLTEEPKRLMELQEPADFLKLVEEKGL